MQWEYTSGSPPGPPPPPEELAATPGAFAPLEHATRQMTATVSATAERPIARDSARLLEGEHPVHPTPSLLSEPLRLLGTLSLRRGCGSVTGATPCHRGRSRHAMGCNRRETMRESPSGVRESAD